MTTVKKIDIENIEEPQNSHQKLNEFKRIARIILILAIPVIIESISQTLMGIADMYFVGKLGPEAIASVGITNTVMNVYMTVNNLKRKQVVHLRRNNNGI